MKFIADRIDADGVYRISKRAALLRTSNWHNDRAYFRCVPHGTLPVTIEMSPCSPRYLYALKSEIEQEFYTLFTLYVAERDRAGFQIKQACLDFLALYDINDEEYQWGSAYRRYVRFKAKATAKAAQQPHNSALFRRHRPAGALPETTLRHVPIQQLHPNHQVVRGQ